MAERSKGHGLVPSLDSCLGQGHILGFGAHKNIFGFIYLLIYVFIIIY
jgi:hypothetical protein